MATKAQAKKAIESLGGKLLVNGGHVEAVLPAGKRFDVSPNVANQHSVTAFSAFEMGKAYDTILKKLDAPIANCDCAACGFQTRFFGR